MNDEAKCCAATPAETLEQHIMDPCIAKTEAEHWAAREIERLREAMSELREASYDYARLVQVENFPASDMAVGRAYERLRGALGKPIGLTTKPRLATNN